MTHLSRKDNTFLFTKSKPLRVPPWKQHLSFQQYVLLQAIAFPSNLHLFFAATALFSTNVPCDQRSLFQAIDLLSIDSSLFLNVALQGYIEGQLSSAKSSSLKLFERLRYQLINLQVLLRCSFAGIQRQLSHQQLFICNISGPHYQG